MRKITSIDKEDGYLTRHFPVYQSPIQGEDGMTEGKRGVGDDGWEGLRKGVWGSGFVSLWW